MFMKKNYNKFENNSYSSDNSHYSKRKFEHTHRGDETQEDVKIEENEGESDVKKPRVFNKNYERKQWRLIIRNLPFVTKAEDIQNACSKIGRFNEVVLPPSKKLPNKCAGFAFVQFLEKADAEKGKEFFNNNKFMGRNVAADWSLAKDTYETANHEEKEKLKQKVKLEKVEEGQNKSSSKVKKFEEEEVGSDEENDDEEEDEGNDDSEDSGDEDSKKDDKKFEKTFKNSNLAVSEGRVVFVRNLSFDTVAESLKQEMEKVAEVELALICKFKDSEHSKGTAFVHFKTAEDAENCIRASEQGDFYLDGRPLNCILALPRETAEQMEKKKLAKVPKDSRNLRLLRFGLIREGTAAANGMSKEDTVKRVKLTEVARKKLENLHMFVSPVRLLVHNLPPNMDDAKLKTLCIEAGGEGAYVTESRIWRDKTEDKLGKSKGFAFVAFDEHKHALACLLKLNNNPKTFTDEKRPIVEFCIENLSALQAKERRKNSKMPDKATYKEVNEKVRNQIKESVGEIHASGMKFLPKFLGKKLRHKDMSKSQKKKLKVKSKKITKEPKKSSKGKMMKEDAKTSGKKTRSNKKFVTKYLALH